MLHLSQIQTCTKLVVRRLPAAGRRQLLIWHALVDSALVSAVACFSSAICHSFN